MANTSNLLKTFLLPSLLLIFTSCSSKGNQIDPEPGLVIYEDAHKYHDIYVRAVRERGRVCSFLPLKKPVPSFALNSNTIRDLISKTRKGVINIYVRSETKEPLQLLGAELSNVQASKERESLGSGFICSPEGIALSNAHVVKHARELYAKLYDGSIVGLEVLAADYSADISILKLKGSGPYYPLSLAPAGRLQQGDLVVAIGNPLGLDHNASHGIVTNPVRFDASKPVGFNPTLAEVSQGLLVSDTHINPGNSGGPLIDLEGNVVGINTSTADHTQGISFSIPTEMIFLFIEEAGQRYQESRLEQDAFE